MGEVYRARDERLKRDVAVKVLPAELAADPERRSRFEREARAASGLSHPNILTVYDIGTHDSTVYIAMELVEGGTLKDLVASGPVPVKKLLEISVQIAEGLAAAHAAGIVHRDLKPQNVMVSKHGFAKILDFGLAKLVTPEDQEVSALKTAVGDPTRPGMVMGTVGYMSPEQASGRPLDFRSDQFSFGSIVYELATGKRAFERGTNAETLTAIIREEPDPVAQLNPRVPSPVRWLVERCLSKDPEDRFGTTKDLARDLADVRDHLSEASISTTTDQSAAAAAAVRAGRPKWTWLLVALAVLAAGRGRPLRRPARLARRASDLQAADVPPRRDHLRALRAGRADDLLLGELGGQPARDFHQPTRKPRVAPVRSARRRGAGHVAHGRARPLAQPARGRPVHPRRDAGETVDGGRRVSPRSAR